MIGRVKTKNLPDVIPFHTLHFHTRPAITKFTSSSGEEKKCVKNLYKVRETQTHQWKVNENLAGGNVSVASMCMVHRFTCPLHDTARLSDPAAEVTELPPTPATTLPP
ncbi:hypothetical protein E2C01_002866 [Portunus trituberculatus]|uniref:Uncharacterized protein n=1 Tax=Portunus trituberculatus TaxID=210409 RepID=A0A5B7CNM6_PORTR|nr:hypothetical protein [Portunus trituberculatus]